MVTRSRREAVLMPGWRPLPCDGPLPSAGTHSSREPGAGDGGLDEGVREPDTDFQAGPQLAPAHSLTLEAPRAGGPPEDRAA